MSLQNYSPSQYIVGGAGGEHLFYAPPSPPGSASNGQYIPSGSWSAWGAIPDTLCNPGGGYVPQMDTTPPPSLEHQHGANVDLSGGNLGPDGVLTTGYTVRPFKRRCTANRKERRRTQSINTAFAELRDCIPNVPADTKLSKIKTLRLATSYISYLSRVLADDAPPAAFIATDLGRGGRMEERRKKITDNTSSITTTAPSSVSSGMSPTERKGKGRTGWPQHVWALELKQ